jgi:hypothetical protein
MARTTQGDMRSTIVLSQTQAHRLVKHFYSLVVMGISCRVHVFCEIRSEPELASRTYRSILRLRYVLLPFTLFFIPSPSVCLLALITVPCHGEEVLEDAMF